MNVLEKQKLVLCSHGGVELVKRKNVPLPFRYHKMKTAESKIAKRVADYIFDDAIKKKYKNTTFVEVDAYGGKNKVQDVYRKNMYYTKWAVLRKIEAAYIYAHKICKNILPPFLLQKIGEYGTIICNDTGEGFYHGGREK